MWVLKVGQQFGDSIGSRCSVAGRCLTNAFGRVRIGVAVGSRCNVAGQVVVSCHNIVCPRGSHRFGRPPAGNCGVGERNHRAQDPRKRESGGVNDSAATHRGTHGLVPTQGRRTSEGGLEGRPAQDVGGKEGEGRREVVPAGNQPGLLV